MLRQDINILETTTTDDSGWMDVSTFESWSLFIDALESGASIKVYGIYNLTPVKDQQLLDGTTGAYLGITLGPVSGSGGPFMISDDSFLDSCSPPNKVRPHMVLVKKTQGGSPAATNVYMYSRTIS